MTFSPIFSGHETFVLRGNWLKKAYDLLKDTPTLFTEDDAFVRLGVGKNMAQSIRFWGKTCGVFERQGTETIATPFGERLLADDGWDPFLVLPATQWLLHWNIASQPNTAFTWYYTFNLLRHGEFTPTQLANAIQTYVADHEGSVPSDTTIQRDIQCMLGCYQPPTSQTLKRGIEDALACPLTELALIQPVSQHSYRIISGYQPTLPDKLIVWAIGMFMQEHNRQSMAFTDLAYTQGSPGRIFRLDEDGLLERLQRLEELTDNAVIYTDQAGIRQVYWKDFATTFEPLLFLEQVFA